MKIEAEVTPNAFKLTELKAEIELLRLETKVLHALIQSHSETMQAQAKEIERLHCANQQLEETNGSLRAEVRRLKDLKAKPSIRPSNLSSTKFSL